MRGVDEGKSEAKSLMDWRRTEGAIESLSMFRLFYPGRRKVRIREETQLQLEFIFEVVQPTMQWGQSPFEALAG